MTPTDPILAAQEHLTAVQIPFINTPATRASVSSPNLGFEAIEESPTAAMHQMRLLIWGGIFTSLVYTAAKLGIADLLAQGPQSLEALAAATGAQASALGRVLRVLVSIGVFTQDARQCFALTPRAAWLQTAVPGSLRTIALYWGSPWLWNIWPNLQESLMTDQNAFILTHGEPFFTYLDQHPEATAMFHQVMSKRGISAESRYEQLVTTYDFSGAQCVVDIGGSQGGLLSMILQAYPMLRGVLFDLPVIVAEAHTHLAAVGVAERCSIRSGDFFEAVPEGGDVYLLSAILHDWGDDQALQILRNCRRVMPPHGKLLVYELLLSAGNEFSYAKIGDIMMLALLGGQQRTETEFRLLFERAGFQLKRTLFTPSGDAILESLPIESTVPYS